MDDTAKQGPEETRFLVISQKHIDVTHHIEAPVIDRLPLTSSCLDSRVGLDNEATLASQVQW